jgi:hypothetical protein
MCAVVVQYRCFEELADQRIASTAPFAPSVRQILDKNPTRIRGGVKVLRRQLVHPPLINLELETPPWTPS